VSPDLSSHAPLGADESKNLKERFCTSALSAERLGPSAIASVYVPGGPAAGTAPNIGQECGHEPAGAHTESLGPAMMDYAMVMGPDGVTCTLHTIGCPCVQAKRDAGEPVMNLFQCTRDPRDLDIELHCCLLSEEPRS